MKRIVVNLSERSIDRAIKDLRTYKASITGSLDELTKRIADYGATVAGATYAAVPVTDGNYDISVRVVQKPGTCQIVASGESVCFAELGTGVLAGAGKAASVPGVEARPGSWSETHSQMFSKHGFWYYMGKRFTGTAPYPGMYTAAKAMRERMKDIAKEVFSK